jgi:chromosome partitioning protein
MAAENLSRGAQVTLVRDAERSASSCLLTRAPSGWRWYGAARHLPTAENRMPATIAFANQKGGVAKTTSVSNLSFAFAETGLRVLTIDLDPQGSLTIAMGHDSERLDEQQATLYHSLVGDKPLGEVIIPGNPDLVPSGILLAGAEQELGMDVTRSGQLALRHRLHEVRSNYDVVLIDSPPSLGMLTVNGLVAATHVVVPTQTEHLASVGIRALLNTLARLRRGLNPELQILGVLPTMYSHRQVHDGIVLEGIRDMMAKHGIHVFDPIGRHTSLARASLEGKPSLVLEPGTPGSRAYRDLAREIAHELRLARAAA